ncbi:MAG: ParB/RepB/Spo0J family partition protein, partial [Desulfobacterales bacterium]|nr:ParB/RepB/Spo0J family partition protein [Desulfobacterales bacterium]
IGLLNVPFLMACQPSGYVVISGFRRIEACRQLGWTRIEANLVEPETSPLTCAKLAITDNSFQRPLNLIEQSRACHLLCRHIRGAEQMAETARSLNLPVALSLIKKIEPLCQLPPAIQDGILSDTISMPVAVELGSLETDAAECIAQLFNELKISLSKQRQVLSMVTEIAAREKISILDVINDPQFQSILSDDDPDRTQKASHLLFFLKKRRYPEITRVENEFKKNIHQLKLGNQIKLIPPPHFEGSTYTLSLQFSSLAELQERNESLVQMINHPILKNILPPGNY